MLGVTLRSLYRFIDEGALPAYRFGRVIRLQEAEVTAFIESCRVAPGSLEHLYPEARAASRSDGDSADERPTGSGAADAAGWDEGAT